jgi:hypothetical protein
MSGKKDRKAFSTINKFQRQMLYPVLLACFLFLVFLYTAILYIAYIDANLVMLYPARNFGLERAVPWFMAIDRLQDVVPWLVMLLAVALILLMTRTYFISSRITGAYQRILRELDETIEGKRKEPIRVREGDEMFKELLKRINVLISKIKS